MHNQLHLTVVSQEKKLVDTTTDSVTVMTKQGEVTILPQHIPLFSKVEEGLLTYREGQAEHMLVISQGFMTVDQEGHITIMVDSAVLDRDITPRKVDEAVRAAQEQLTAAADKEELIRAEAALRRALLEAKVAQRSRKLRS